MIDLIEQNLEHLKQFCEAHEVESLYVFGSATTEDFHEKSDVDFLITFKEKSKELSRENYFAMYEKIENLLGRKIDLITERSLKTPFFTASVEHTRKLIYKI